jgi:FlaA1/EpsC-like NDP-sugar epimerase
VQQLTGIAVIDRLSRRRHFWLMTFDACVWIFAVAFAALARLDFDPGNVHWGITLAAGIAAAALFTLIAWPARLHDGRASLGSLEEMIQLGAAALGAGVTVYFANLFVTVMWPTGPYLPRSVPLMATLCAILVMAWGRAMVRAIRENAATPQDHSHRGQPVLVIGAGDGGKQLIKSMHRDPSSRWYPVGILDDDPHNRYLRIDGVPVLGKSADLATMAERTGVSTVVVAIPSAGAAFLRDISGAAADAGVAVKVLPGVNELLRSRVGIKDVRDIDLPDLLGRRQIDTDIASVASYLTGQRVLVTGAGGSIGSELCRQISRWDPAELIMLDRDESALQAVQISIDRRGRLNSPDTVLADIRDGDRIREIFARRRPQVVFHAAALKHLLMLEQCPGEAVKTNIWGTLTVLDAAKAIGVQRFVNISTDKAANPISVLGYSKRIAEGLTAGTAMDATGTYLSVRFGNVLGSRGSVLTAFAAQIAAGGPVTVTDREVTRYFMTVDEAVQLVIQAGISGRDGEALVLDMGRPVKIDDVARHLVKISGQEIEIEYTGLLPGEKLHEDLFSIGEPDCRPVHPLLSHVDVPAVGRSAQSLDPTVDDGSLVRQLQELCHQMSPRSRHMVGRT